MHGISLAPMILNGPLNATDSVNPRLPQAGENTTEG